MAVSIMIVGMFVSSCSNRRFRLRNISDALAVCRFQLEEMRPRSNASIGELVDMINTTQTVTDSLSLFITRDTTIAKNPKAQQEIYQQRHRGKADSKGREQIQDPICKSAQQDRDQDAVIGFYGSSRSFPHSRYRHDGGKSSRG